MEQLQCGDEGRVRGPSKLFNNCKFSLGHANPLLTFIFVVAFSDLRNREALEGMVFQQHLLQQLGEIPEPTQQSEAPEEAAAEPQPEA